MKMNKLQTRRGFTLIELLVVIAIVAVHADAVAVPRHRPVPVVIVEVVVVHDRVLVVPDSELPLAHIHNRTVSLLVPNLLQAGEQHVYHVLYLVIRQFKEDVIKVD